MATAGSGSSKRANELIPISIGVDHPKAAVVAIDLHRGHLDMAVATMPTLPEVAAKVIAANKRLFDWCRSVGIPIIHQLTSYRDAEEIRANPFWRTRAEDPSATRKNGLISAVLAWLNWVHTTRAVGFSRAAIDSESCLPESSGLCQTDSRASHVPPQMAPV